jgi:hypothetical protein
MIGIIQHFRLRINPSAKKESAREKKSAKRGAILYNVSCIGSGVSVA